MSKNSLAYENNNGWKHAKAPSMSSISETSSEESELKPRKSQFPERISITNSRSGSNIQLITSNISLQDKLQKSKKKNKKTAFRKTVVWFKEAFSGNPEYSNSDWEEENVREQAVRKLKRKKLKEFKQNLKRQSRMFPDLAKDEEQLIATFENQPIRITTADALFLKKEIENTMENVYEENEEKRITKMAEKDAKPKGRLSMAFSILTKGKKAIEEQEDRQRKSIAFLQQVQKSSNINMQKKRQSKEEQYAAYLQRIKNEDKEKSPSDETLQSDTEEESSASEPSQEVTTLKQDTQPSNVSIQHKASVQRSVSFVPSENDDIVKKTYRKSVFPSERYPTSEELEESEKHEQSSQERIPYITQTSSDLRDMAQRITKDSLNSASFQSRCKGVQYPSILEEKLDSEDEEDTYVNADDIESDEEDSADHSDSLSVSCSTDSDPETESVVLLEDPSSFGDYSKISVSIDPWFNEQWKSIAMKPIKFLETVAEDRDFKISIGRREEREAKKEKTKKLKYHVDAENRLAPVYEEEGVEPVRVFPKISFTSVLTEFDKRAESITDSIPATPKSPIRVKPYLLRNHSYSFMKLDEFKNMNSSMKVVAKSGQNTTDQAIMTDSESKVEWVPLNDCYSLIESSTRSDVDLEELGSDLKQESFVSAGAEIEKSNEIVKKLQDQIFQLTAEKASLHSTSVEQQMVESTGLDGPELRPLESISTEQILEEIIADNIKSDTLDEIR